MRLMRLAPALLCLVLATPAFAVDGGNPKIKIEVGSPVASKVVPANVAKGVLTPAPAPAAAPAPASQPTKVVVTGVVKVAAAPEVNPVAQVSAIVAAFKSEHVRAGIAGILCLLVWVWRRFASKLLIGKIPNKWLPLVMAGVAFLAAIPTTLAATPWSWSAFLWQGLITGAEAMAFWSVLFKFVLPSVPEAPAKE
jgi:hypothetical protein